MLEFKSSSKRQKGINRIGFVCCMHFYFRNHKFKYSIIFSFGGAVIVVGSVLLLLHRAQIITFIRGNCNVYIDSQAMESNKNYAFVSIGLYEIFCKENHERTKKFTEKKNEQMKRTHEYEKNKSPKAYNLIQQSRKKNFK